MCSGGDLYVFEDREAVSAAEKAHSAAVLSLAEAEEGAFLVSGGKDRSVKARTDTRYS